MEKITLKEESLKNLKSSIGRPLQHDFSQLNVGEAYKFDYDMPLIKRMRAAMRYHSSLEINKNKKFITRTEDGHFFIIRLS